MNRSKAKAVQTATQSANIKHLKEKNEIVDLDDKVKSFDHLTSDENYTEEQVFEVAQEILTSEGFSTKNLFVSQNESQLRERLMEMESENNCWTFFVLKVSENIWASCWIGKKGNNIDVLFKNPLGIDLQPKMQKVVDEIFPGSMSKYHQGKELVRENQSGPMSLKNMETIVKGVKEDAEVFIQKFESIQFCMHRELRKVKENFKEKLIARVSSTLIKDLAKDNDQQKFSVELNKFIKNILIFKEAYFLGKAYSVLIQEESSKIYHDPDYVTDKNTELTIGKARTSLLNDKSLDAKIKNESEQHVESNLKNKYPKRMWILEKLLSMRNRTMLKSYCMTMNIEYESLISVYDLTTKDAQNDQVAQTSMKPDEIDAKVLIQNDEPLAQERGKTIDDVLNSLKFYPDDIQEANKRKALAKLKGDFMKIKKFYDDWSGKTVRDVRSWFDQKKGALTSNDMLEAIALLDRVNNEVTGGHMLRVPQIISVLVFLQPHKNHGKLVQIQTGEGKTVIVSFVAALKVLQGNEVDVITSNEVLALESVESRKRFYELVGLSVACNNADESYSHGPRSCYDADIVYGSIGNFQFDFLRDSFEGFETRSKRTFDTVMLDEVDSMLIDNGGHTAKLSSPFPGMESLKFIFIKIWQELHKAESIVADSIEKTLEAKKQELQNDSVLLDDEKQNIYDLFRKETINDIMPRIKIDIRKSKPCDLKIIPNHLAHYANANLDTWIENAIYAKYDCKEFENYVIKLVKGENVVVPVDFQNTGVTLMNTVWENGLHQFVQLKHNLRISAVSLTSCFISNYGYIQRYGKNIYGLTGTLGSSQERKLLSKIYDVDYAIMPSYKEKIFEELEGVVTKDAHWNNLVALESFSMTSENRSILIICETIKEAQQLEKNIRALYALEDSQDFGITTYLDEDGVAAVDATVGVRQIIIATNIAGRGTDLKTSDELEQNGGLHVLLSYLPVNQRVQDQAFGRTSRQGKSGTARLIIKESDVINLGLQIKTDTTFDDIIEARDMVEKVKLENVESVELPKIKFKDEIFAEFTLLFVKLRHPDRHLAKELKEFWAFWLLRKYENEKTLQQKKIKDELEEFKTDASSILGTATESGKISHNPFYLIKKAEDLLSKSKIPEAKELLNSAVDLSHGNPQLLSAAYFKLFEVSVESGHQILERLMKALKDLAGLNIFVDTSKDEEYKKNALNALEKSEEALKIEYDYYQSVLNDDDFKSILVNEENNVPLKHLISKLNILNYYKIHLKSLQLQIKNSGEKGLAMTSKIKHYLKDFKPSSDVEKKFKESITDEELEELSWLGINTTYALREVHDVPKEIIHSSQGQIVAGLALIVSGLIFPPSAPILFSLAGTLISEGFCDIVIELISKGNEAFNAASYIKGKAISYGITIATMGISALLTTKKMLNFAIKACKKLSALLRSCPFLKTVFEKVATKLDKFALYLVRLKELKEFNKLSKIDQLRHMETLQKAGDLQKLNALGGIESLVKIQSLAASGKLNLGRISLLKSALVAVGKETIMDVTMSVFMEKVVTKGLEVSLETCKSHIRDKVEKTIKEYIDMNRIKLLKNEQIMQLIEDALSESYGKMAVDALREIALGIIRHSYSWKSKLTVLAIETTFSLHLVKNYTKKFCDKFNEQMILKSRENQIVNEFTEQSISMAVDQVTNHIYSILIQICGKHASTFVVTPLFRSAVKKLSGEKETELTTEEREKISDFYELIEAYKTLGVKNGSNEQEIKESLKEKLKEHNDRKDVNAGEKAKSAYVLIEQNLHKDSVAYDNIQRDMGHKGDIQNISREKEVHIIVEKTDRNGNITAEEFGRSYKGNGTETITLIYENPTSDKPGHYKSKDENPGLQVPSGENNCLFDSLAHSLSNRSIETSSEELRSLTEKWSAVDIVIGMSNLMNNPVTRNLCQKVQKGLLVGGFARPHKTEAIPGERPGEFSIDVGQSREIKIYQDPVNLGAVRVTHTIGTDYNDEISNLPQSRNFSRGRQEFHDQINITDLYKYQTQQEKIRSIAEENSIGAGTPNTLRKYKVFLFDKNAIIFIIERGHLAPAADFPGDEGRTYHLLNTVPMWASVNNGNWSKIENEVRSQASNARHLEIETGSLKIPIRDRNGASFYLDEKDEKIPVPLYLYKKVRNVDTEENKVYVTINHPNPPEADIDIFKNNFGSENLKPFGSRELNKGLTFLISGEAFDAGKLNFD